MMGNSEIFLQKYRVLEGLLEKRYAGRKLSSSSVVMEYLRDADSKNVRVELDLLREIRNLLSHNADPDGSPVVEPSDGSLEKLERVLEHVKRPKLACEFGTPAERVLCAHPNDALRNVMRNMRKKGYSHVPVMEKGVITGVFSVRCLFDYLAENGLDALDDDARIASLGELYRLDRNSGERYSFVAANCPITSVRNAFSNYSQRDRRLSTVFVTEHGSRDEPLMNILTPWDVLSDDSPTEETQDGESQ